jgi:RNA polymerase sigma factor (TIGR02999 family)
MSDADSSLNSVYEELRRLAVRKIAAEGADYTLSPTALVHEAWLRLNEASVAWNDQRHFFRLAATAMRRILVERARARLAEKRGGDLKRMPLDDIAAPLPDRQLTVLDDSLKQLARDKPEHAQLVELRFFGGLTSDEAASAMGISPATADRMWRYARSWLKIGMIDGNDV